MKKLVLTFVAITLSAVVFAQTSGGDRTATNQATVQVNEVMDLTLTQLQQVNFVFDNTSDYDNGKTIVEATQFSVKSNKPWNVRFRAATPTFSGGDNNMPVSILSLAKSGANPVYQTLTTTDSVDPLASGNRGASSVSGNTFTVNYKANPGYAYAPANYSVDIIYTISAQ